MVYYLHPIEEVNTITNALRPPEENWIVKLLWCFSAIHIISSLKYTSHGIKLLTVEKVYFQLKILLSATLGVRLSCESFANGVEQLISHVSLTPLSPIK